MPQTQLLRLSPPVCCSLQAGFVGTYFLSGLIGALAETGCIIIVSNRFADKLGTVMATVGTVCGVGCMVGPLLGGVVYDWGKGLPVQQFCFPFIVFSVSIRSARSPIRQGSLQPDPRR